MRIPAGARRWEFTAIRTSAHGPHSGFELMKTESDGWAMTCVRVVCTEPGKYIDGCNWSKRGRKNHPMNCGLESAVRLQSGPGGASSYRAEWSTRRGQ